MRTKHWFLAVPASFVVAGLVAGGCGGSSTDAGPVDSGIDATAPVDAYVAPDVGIDAPVDAAMPVDACLVDADLATLNVPDAEINDSGHTTDDCITCARSKCPNLITACDKDCLCKTALVGFYQCIQTPTGTLTSCGASLISAGTNAINLGTCVYAGCQTACGIPAMVVPDAAASDGATDDGATDDGAADAAGE